MRDFSGILPTGLFIDLMGIDPSRPIEFMKLADTFMRVSTSAGKAQNVSEIDAVLEKSLAQRRQRPLDGDIMSVLIGAREPDGSPFPHEEVINLAGPVMGFRALPLVWQAAGGSMAALSRSSRPSEA